MLCPVISESCQNSSDSSPARGGDFERGIFSGKEAWLSNASEVPFEGLSDFRLRLGEVEAISRTGASVRCGEGSIDEVEGDVRSRSSLSR